MQLIINSLGTGLRVQDGCFLVTLGERKEAIAPRKVSSIFITTGVNLTTDALQLAVEHNIDVVLLNRFGDPYGRFWHDRLGSVATIRRRQLHLTESAEGTILVKEWLGKKLDNQIRFLEKLRTTRTRVSAEITAALEAIRPLTEQLEAVTGTPAEAREAMFQAEAQGARVYFDLLSRVLPERFHFSGRSRNPARDPFNCLLNYAYGVLYGKVERACVLAGLDPYIGILHTDNYNKKSMVFDLIENFRIWADRTVMGLFATRKVADTQFDTLQNGMTLNKEGKALLLERLVAFLEESIRFNGRHVKRQDAIQLFCHRLANRLLGKPADPVPDILTEEELLSGEGR
ncbi:MAG: CRISPR-associated endonuclease Cas1 [Candidatus Riflebacteria bacterium]|nr:CRISPR-associated endonuclease Cas1 [Candidatus Riflebacteria bacterium]